MMVCTFVCLSPSWFEEMRTLKAEVGEIQRQTNWTEPSAVMEKKDYYPCGSPYGHLLHYHIAWVLFVQVSLLS